MDAHRDEHRDDPPGRVGSVRRALFLLWGDELPPGPDPVRTLLADGTEVDDANGRRAGLVVQGDELTLPVLQRVIDAAADPAAVLDLLPEGLAARLRAPGGERVAHPRSESNPSSVRSQSRKAAGLSNTAPGTAATSGATSGEWTTSA